MVPDGVEEVELARINLEQKGRAQKLILGDISKLSLHGDISVDAYSEKDMDLWMITGGRSTMVNSKHLPKCFYVYKLSQLTLSGFLICIFHCRYVPV